MCFSSIILWHSVSYRRAAAEGGNVFHRCFLLFLVHVSPRVRRTYALPCQEERILTSPLHARPVAKGGVGRSIKKISFFLRRRFGKAEEVRIVDRPTSERGGGRVKKGASTVRTRNETLFPEEDEIIISPPFFVPGAPLLLAVPRSRVPPSSSSSSSLRTCKHEKLFFIFPPS